MDSVITHLVGVISPLQKDKPTCLLLTPPSLAQPKRIGQEQLYQTLMYLAGCRLTFSEPFAGSKLTVPICTYIHGSRLYIFSHCRWLEIAILFYIGGRAKDRSRKRATVFLKSLSHSCLIAHRCTSTHIYSDVSISISHQRCSQAFKQPPNISRPLSFQKHIKGMGAFKAV